MFSLCTKKKEFCDLTEVLANTMVVIILQYINVSNHIVHTKRDRSFTFQFFKNTIIEKNQVYLKIV